MHASCPFQAVRVWNLDQLSPAHLLCEQPSSRRTKEEEIIHAVRPKPFLESCETSIETSDCSRDLLATFVTGLSLIGRYYISMTLFLTTTKLIRKKNE